WHGNTYMQSGNYTHTMTNAVGCDSVVTLHLTVNQTVAVTDTRTVCASELPIVWNGVQFAGAGTQTANLQTANGCDSVVTMTLTVNHSTADDTTAVACESFSWHGNTYTQSGNYTYTTTNVAGCDSVVTLHLTVMADFVPQVTVSGTLTACGNETATLSLTGSYHDYLWSTGDTTATITVGSAGYYWVTIGDGNGCTSVSEPVHLGVSELVSETPALCMVGVEDQHNLVVWEPLADTDVAEYRLYRENGQANIFEPLAVIPAGSGNAYADTTADPSVRAWRYKITAADTCGGETPMSALHKTVHLTINQGLGNSYNLIWTPYEGFEFASYRLYRGTANNNLQLIQTMPSTLTSFTDQNPAGDALFYQIEVVMDGSCVQETRDITFTGARSNIVYNGVPVATDVTVEACESYDWNGEVLTSSGEYTHSFNSVLGYDSVVTLHLTIHQPAASEFTVSCPDSCYTWNGTEYCASGDYTQTLQTVHGCDSVVTLHLTITVGIDDHDLAGSVKVFPNPANSMLNVQWAMGDEAATIELLDVTGKLLRTISATGETTSINVSSLADGMYFVRVTTEAGMVTKPFVVKR
ncbi:MAG: T9SS type A sorting domain-containing protein, partial [Bacteroidales bacterium]|nr:T9SS type A sorting domain-containing protein [Bacteroidales bacterium]